MEQGKKVLLVEDSPFDAEIIIRMLSKAEQKYSVKVVGTKAAFLDELAGFSPDIILSDNSLPSFSGPEALDIVRQQNLDIPFILVTGTVSEEFAVDVMKRGADDYVLKDRLTRLPSAIEHALRQRASDKERRTALDNLINSEMKYRTLITSITDGFMAIDKEWNVTYINSTAERLFGRPNGQMMGKSMLKEFPEGAGRAFFNAYQEVLRTGANKYIEDYSVALDKWLLVTIYPAENGVLVFLRDVTEQRNAEREARANEEKYKILVQRITDAFIAVDKEWRYTYLNRQAGILIQRNPSDLIGKNVWEVFPDAIGSSTYNAFRKALSEQVYVSNLDYYAPLDLWQENHIYPSEDGLSVFIRDITEKKKAEIQLQRSYEEKDALAARLSAILNTLPANIALLDGNGVIVDVNDAWREFAKGNGFSGNNFAVGSNYIEVARKADGEAAADGHRVAEGITKVLEGTVSMFRMEYECHSPDEQRWFRMVVNPIEREQFEGAVVMHIDVSEIKRLEKERLENRLDEQKRLTEAVLSAQERERNAIGVELHDNVNQILVGTILMMGMVQATSEKGREMIGNCVSNIQLAISENRKIAHELVTPDQRTETLIQQVERLCDTMLVKSGISTRILKRTFNERLLTSQQKLTVYRILQELCTNIIKYASANLVVIEVKTANNFFSVSVSDDGKGVDKDKVVHGIGLKNIASRLEVLGGSYTVQTSPGQGFELSFTIPLHAH